MTTLTSAPLAPLLSRLFEEAAQASDGSVLDTDTGTRYRREILEVGGSRPAMESFKAFRGREPNIDALLRHNGMAPGAAH